MKEFNLSEKELTPHEFYEHQGGFTKEDVKEFIKLENKLLLDLEFKKITFLEFHRKREELAGDKLK